MQLLLASLCDSASDYQGKLCILGTFDTLCAPQFPVVHPQCSLAVRMLFSPEDIGLHEMVIEMVDDAGKTVMPPFKPAMEVSFPQGAIPFVTRNVVLNLQRLRFEKPGVYYFNITMDGGGLVSLPIRVTRFEEMRPTAGPAG